MTLPAIVPVFRDKRVRGWPKHENGGAAEYRTLSDVMRSSFDTDAHFTAYSAPQVQRRLTMDAVLHRDRFPDGVAIRALVFDVDYDLAHAATGGTKPSAPEEWWLAELSKIVALLEAHPGGFIYRTRGGYRIVYELVGVALRDSPDADAWASRYVAYCAYLRRAFGIVADHSCHDWTRLFRAPRVVRDGRREVRDTVGNANAIAIWTIEPTKEDFELAKTLRRERKPKKSKATASREERPAAIIGEGVFFHAFKARGELGPEVESGKWAIACPWESEHSTRERFDTSTVLFAPAPGDELGWPHCSHAHCALRDLRDWLGHFTRDELEAARSAAGLVVATTADAQGYPSDWDAPASSVAELKFRLLRSEEGRVLKNTANVMTILAEHEEWRGVIAWDAFAEAVVTLKAPPMRPSDRPLTYDVGEWTEEDSTRTAAWLASELELDVASSTVDQAVAAVARRNVVHPVRDYLRSLAWDTSPRLDLFLVTYFGAEETAYTRGVGARWMISAVARIFEPGCQADCTLVLESKQQGTGKSTGLEVLAGKAWFADTGITIGDKDSYQALRRKWVYELGELDALKGRDVTRTKNFLSARSDNYRPSFGRRNRDFPRQVVFAGTTNESQYLEDRTGNRRFWPVKVIRVDVPGLRRDRDQLWAEARARFERGEAWHVDTPEFRALCEAQQEQRTHEDPWKPFVVTWLESDAAKRLRAAQGGGLTSSDVLVGALNMPPKDLERPDEMRVASVLRELGLERDEHQKLVSGRRTRLWRATQPIRSYVEVESKVVHLGGHRIRSDAQPTQPTQPIAYAPTQAGINTPSTSSPGTTSTERDRGRVGRDLDQAVDDGHAFSDLLGGAQ